jgi:peptidoglycan biosynthesis protein MviN/MurJ (putative lipid II flippase)
VSNRQLLDYLLLGSAWISVLLIFIGFYKPWIVLWWEDVQHRKKVIKYYGTSAALFYGLYWLLRLIEV